MIFMSCGICGTKYKLGIRCPMCNPKQQTAEVRQEGLKWCIICDQNIGSNPWCENCQKYKRTLKMLQTMAK